MVCALEENLAFCVIRHASNPGTDRAEFHLPASSTVGDLYQEVGRIIKCHQDSFCLTLKGSPDDYVILLRLFEKKAIETLAGFKVGPDTKNTLMVRPLAEWEKLSFCGFTNSGDFETSAAPPPPPPLPAAPPASASAPVPAPASASTSASASAHGDFNCSTTFTRPENAYVGLVNQAMTCYLNSLLQALYMTPEFRNAIYNWEFDGSPSEESKSIPYQLQKLFLNLQTSKKSAVETTELTRSFGWDSWEAWQQHDIQELCRVMFDTLEQKFKNTKQADFINRLYEGKMIDYVKCLECSTEKSREDTFLDIPLPVRPFGSNVAYGSVEEALRAFVQPETLEGNNQYHCDTCNKKCDAHKGLKFSKFPYLLTLHLKRFDFDFNTLHRIKLNDKVSFPEKLNLNSFIPREKKADPNNESTPEETTMKCDDSCTTDSGSALDDEGCQGFDSVSASNSHENHHSDYQEDDEGIDVEQQHENEKNKQNAAEPGPYIYELFSIMIHSGSAAGGHYYAYIKDFKDGDWYCFNDQNVAKITYDDIRKTYGGGPIRGYYSGAYSSSTNAYMLMYRQIDKERNASAMTVAEFPEHIKLLHKKLEKQKEMEDQRDFDDLKDLRSDSIMRDCDSNLLKLKIHYTYSYVNAVSVTKVYVHKEYTLKETVQVVYKMLNLEKLGPIERCRLVAFDKLKNSIECSFEGRESETIGDICMGLKHRNFLVEVLEENEEFVVYKPGNINTVAIVVNIETKEIAGPTSVQANLSQTVKEYKEVLANQLKLPGTSIHIVLEKFSNEPKILRNDESTLRREDFYDGIKVFIATSVNSDEVEIPFILFKLHIVTELFKHVITLHLTLPDVDRETLEKLNIPPLDQSQSANSIKQSYEPLLCTRSRGPSPNPKDPSPQPPPDPEDESPGPTGPHSDQSASEDSSLTDSERTIVGDAPGDCLAQLSPNGSPAGSDQNVSLSENEGNECPSRRLECIGGGVKIFPCALGKNEESENWDSDDREWSPRNFNYYFKAVPYTDNNSNQKLLKVSMDERMSEKTFKKCLEPFVGVSAEHFKICRTKNANLDSSIGPGCARLNFYKDNERLTVRLGRALKKGEHLGDVFFLKLNSEKSVKYLFEWVIANGTPVSQVKKEILEEMKWKCDLEIPYKRCRLMKKDLENPLRPYLDGDVFDDIVCSWELFVQELPGEEPLTSFHQKLVIVRQLCPATRELKPFEEIVLNTNSIVELKEKISEISGIPVEFIDTADAPGLFPYLNISFLGPYCDVEWNPTTKLSDGSSLSVYDEVQMIFYRDNRNKSKRTIMRDGTILKDRRNRLYSPIKERGLKIYADGTPPRKDESDVD